MAWAISPTTLRLMICLATRSAFIFALSLLITACASHPPAALHGNTVLEQCHQQLSRFKQEVKRQGVNDVQYTEHSHFPYLSFDRFSQSILNHVSTTRDRHQWLAYTSRLAALQRKSEFQNLKVNPGFRLAQLDKCAAKLTQETSDNPQLWLELTTHAPHIASNYQPWMKAFGFYPVASHLALPAINQERNRILGHFDQPPAFPTTHYLLGDNMQPLLPQQTIRRWFENARHESSLFWPQLSADQIHSLHAHYAPLISIATQSRDDRPGRVTMDVRSTPTVDTAKPSVYWDHSYTEFYGQTYLQLHYSLWFPRRTPTRPLDPYAGPFDALLLRLTLDHQGNPMIFDSIHHCGCYHMVFALNNTLSPKPPLKNIEPPIQKIRVRPDNKQRLHINLTEGEHMIAGVEWGNTELQQARPLSPLSYHELRSIPTTDNRHHSLFNSQGLVGNSERLERLYLWPFGVLSAGAMRQKGHHAITFIGERHFDEPNMFESFFLPPQTGKP